jgi:hypothetical protein
MFKQVNLKAAIPCTIYRVDGKDLAKGDGEELAL